MLRLTFTLGAALYAGFVIWGEPETHADERGLQEEPVIVAATDGADFDRPTILGLTPSAPAVTRAAATVSPVPDPAAIAASAPLPSAVTPRLIGEPVVVSLVQPASPTASREADRDLLRVTGSRVNMRSGPSTSNRVVSSLVQGTLAEPIGEEVNGWLEIREVETGLTGFMAARFLDPA
ncbi:peptide-binding protein [Jannaschia pagri]|uniref:Peptide-binding protein n=1 Tax=Jannaschia pagri TaxID=2829797 RepID=A0ABQ4NGV3_9RHOB|nr:MULTISPECIES: SH3 domain-containing protein [unclassified Jannaschia]GIT90241.1 peptide-binding protein [Jannaschia sp. AI_61]GIT93653.1 peptide-binding protein [Jannaschia sp. AI_62]